MIARIRGLYDVSDGPDVGHVEPSVHLADELKVWIALVLIYKRNTTIINLLPPRPR